MKQKRTRTIIMIVFSLSILIGLLIANFTTGNPLYLNFETSFIGFLMDASAVPEISKQGKLTWTSVCLILSGLWLIFSPWIHITK